MAYPPAPPPPAYFVDTVTADVAAATSISVTSSTLRKSTGDLIVAIIRPSTGTVSSGPGNFKTYRNPAAGDKTYISFRFADGTEAATWTWNLSAAVDCSVRIVSIRGASLGAPIAGVAVASGSSVTSLALATQTPTADYALHLPVWMLDGGTSVTLPAALVSRWNVTGSRPNAGGEEVVRSGVATTAHSATFGGTATTADAISILIRADTTPLSGIRLLNNVGYNASNSGVTSFPVLPPANTTFLARDVAFLSVTFSATPTSLVVPSGWNLIRTDGGTYTYYYLMNGTETSSTTWTWSWTGSLAYARVAWFMRGLDNTNPVDVSNGTTATASSITLPTVTTTVAGTVLMTIFGNQSGASLSSLASNLTVVATEPGGGTAGVRVRYDTIHASGTTTFGYAAGYSVSGALAAQAIALRPQQTTLTADLRVSREAVEVVTQGATADARLTRLAVEALTQGATANARLSRLSVEALVQGTTAQARLTRLATEVVIESLIPRLVGQTPKNTSGTTTSLSVSTPSGVAAQDLLLWVLGADSALGTVTVPSGWNLLVAATPTAGEPDLRIYWKIAVSGDVGASYTWSWVNTTAYNGHLFAYRGVDQTNPIHVSALTQSSTTASTLTSPSVTTTNPNCGVIHYFLFGKSGSWNTKPAPAGGIWEMDDQEIGGVSALPIFQKKVTAGATGSLSATNSGAADRWNVATIAIQPPLPGSYLKYWSGSAWALKPLKRWDGTQWKQAILRRWDGTTWRQV